MSEAIQIPAAAMPVVEILRRDVERPTAKLVMSVGAVYRRPRFECGKCPMGLHPDATERAPTCVLQFSAVLSDGEHEHDAWDDRLSAFYVWWDHLTLDQAREAVDLIWPVQPVK